MAQRMFLAAWAADAAQRAEQLQQRLARAGADVRWVRPEQLHLTVKFLGQTPLTRTAAVCKSLAETARQHPPLELELRGIGAFPNIRRPRTLWIGVAAGGEACTAVHESVDRAMADLGYAPERRFHPHLTLGRVRSQRHARELSELLEQHADFAAGRVAIDEILLVASQLTPDGPLYEVIGRAPLGG